MTKLDTQPLLASAQPCPPAWIQLDPGAELSAIAGGEASHGRRWQWTAAVALWRLVWRRRGLQDTLDGAVADGGDGHDDSRQALAMHLWEVGGGGRVQRRL